MLNLEQLRFVTYTFKKPSNRAFYSDTQRPF
jgi:hypothetical protein